MPNEEPYKGGEETITTEEEIQKEIQKFKTLLKNIKKNPWASEHLTRLIQIYEDQLTVEIDTKQAQQFFPFLNSHLEINNEEIRKLKIELEKLLRDNTISKVKIMTVLKVLLIATFFASHPDRDPATHHPLDGLPEKLKAKVIKILFPEWTKWKWINGETWEEIGVPSF